MNKIIVILSFLILIVGCAEQIDKSDNTKEVPNETGQIEEQKTIEPEQKEAEGAIPPTNEGAQIGQEDVKGDDDYGETDVPDTLSNKICGKIPLTQQLSIGDRFYCFAVVNHNPEFCQKIEGNEGEFDEGAEDNKNLCLAHANKDSSYCKKMSDTAGKKTCYFVLSQISGNIDFCGGVDYDGDERQLCYFSFVNALYWEDKSGQITAEHCNKLPEPDRSTCLSFKERDVSLCKNNVNCLTFFEQQMSFCTGKGSILDDCIRDRAMVNKDLSICETLSGEKREDCVGDFAMHISKDISICDKLSDIMKRQQCYIDLAINLADE